MDTRKQPRIAPFPQCKAHFKWGGHIFHGVSVENLGLGGCCLRIPSVGAYGLRSRMLLENLTLIHPDLPRGSVEGRVVWLRAARDSRMEAVATGVQFMEVPEGYAGQMARSIQTQLKARP